MKHTDTDTATALALLQVVQDILATPQASALLTQTVQDLLDEAERRAADVGRFYEVSHVR